MTVVHCWSCQKKLEFADTIGFRADCMYCHADTHVCRNCEFYDPKVYNECRENSADVVREKERANYCEYFQAKSGAGASVDSKKQDMLAAAEALFKKK